MREGFFVASTGQNVGKTTISLGLVSLLKERLSSVGFMKPVGQEFVETADGTSVDKDILLFRETFGLSDPFEAMSPLVLPSGFTREFLDGKIATAGIAAKIKASFQSLASAHDAIIVEGTGHVGVGSIIGLNNAQVAAMLGLPVILVASGGIGAPFDALTLNKLLCDNLHLPIAGIVLNQVRPDQLDKCRTYMTKALKEWNLPLLGVIPHDPLLSTPTMHDYSHLFNTVLIAGEKFAWHHFPKTTLVATSSEDFGAHLRHNELIITPASRDDIILTLLTKHWDFALKDEPFYVGCLLTGSVPPKPSLVEKLKQAHIPTLYAPIDTYLAMKRISAFTAKMNVSDTKKIERARDLVSSNLDLSAI